MGGGGVISGSPHRLKSYNINLYIAPSHFVILYPASVFLERYCYILYSLCSLSLFLLRERHTPHCIVFLVYTCLKYIEDSLSTTWQHFSPFTNDSFDLVLLQTDRHTYMLIMSDAPPRETLSQYTLSHARTHAHTHTHMHTHTQE